MSKKTYTVSYDTEQQFLIRTNDGFNLFELIGVLKIIQKDLVAQANGLSDKPSTIKHNKKVVQKDNN
jgi:hypothetical protein